MPVKKKTEKKEGNQKLLKKYSKKLFSVVVLEKSEQVITYYVHADDRNEAVGRVFSNIWNDIEKKEPKVNDRELLETNEL